MLLAMSHCLHLNQPIESPLATITRSDSVFKVTRIIEELLSRHFLLQMGGNIMWPFERVRSLLGRKTDAREDHFPMQISLGWFNTALKIGGTTSQIALVGGRHDGVYGMMASIA